MTDITRRLFLAVKGNNKNLVCELIESGADVNENDGCGRTALFYAVQESDNDNVVRALIESGADVNKTDNHGHPPLFYAVQQSSNENVIRALIESGADVNKQYIHGKTALLYAVKKRNNEQIVRILIESGADVNENDGCGRTALFYAVQQSNNDNVVNALIESGADVNKTDNHGKTALFYSVQQSDNNYVLHALIEAGADVNEADCRAQTALFYAVQQRSNENVVHALIESGADVNKTDNRAKTALFYSVQQSNNRNVVQALIEAGADVNKTDSRAQTSLFYAVQQSSNENVIRVLIESGADVNKTDTDGQTALFAAVQQSNNRNVVRVLIDAGADVNISDHHGQILLVHAILCNHNEQVVHALIDAGADVNVQQFHKTALHYAVQDSKNENVVRTLIEAGTDDNKSDNIQTALFYAVQQSNNENVVRTLIEFGADVNKTCIHGQPALFYAIQQSSNENVIRALIESGADVNKQYIHGKTALFYAVKKKNNERIVRALIESGADVSNTDIDGQTVLFFAVQQSNNDNVVRALIESSADVNKTDHNDKTALFYAVQQSNNENVVRFLIESGADVNKRYDDGQTALFFAAIQRNNENVVRTIIESGVDVNDVDYDGQTALNCAVQQSYNENVVRTLIEYGADVNITDHYGDPLLVYAVKYSHSVQVVHALIDAGAYVNEISVDGSALCFAAEQSNNENIVRALIECGADVNLTDNRNGHTALVYAVQQSDNENVVQVLIESGVDINKIDKYGKTALFYAVVKVNNENVVRILIDSGADVNISDYEGHTVLRYAVLYSHNVPVVEALIDAGVDVNGKKFDQPALLYAVQERNNESMIRALIKSGADVNRTDKDGQTALFYAVQQSNNENMVRVLIKSGANLNITNVYGQTALFYAVQLINNESVASTLIENCSSILSVRDIYGRTALFYSNLGSSKTISCLLEKGGNRCLQLKDNCNVDVLTFVIDQCVSSQRDSFTPEIFDVFKKHGVKGERFATAIINMMFIKILRFSFLTKWKYEKPFNWLGNVPYSHISDTDSIQYEAFIALAGFYNKYIGRFVSLKRKKVMREIKMLLNEEFYNVSKALVLLVELDADPNSADSNGNTALHYATRLPLLGATEETVMDVCNQLQKFGVQINAKNHQNQTPLLFCLSEDRGSELQSTIKTLVKVCKFLLDHGSSFEETLRSGESVFHLIIKLFQDGLDIEDKAIRDYVLLEVIKLLQLLQPSKAAKTKIVNKSDANLDSPLHLWASLTLPLHEDYVSNVTEDHTFEGFLRIIFNHLLKCGANLNTKNQYDETPLHLCKTWGAVKILIEAGANPNVVDSLGYLPLLAAANNETFLLSQRCFYPDVSEDPISFWRSTIDMGLDPWTGDEQGSVLSILIESEAFVLAKALVDVACEKKYTESETFAVCLLDAICKDKSTKTHCKTVLVQDILESRKQATNATSSLRFCCKKIKEDIAIGWMIKRIDPIYTNSGFREIVKLLRLHGADANSCLEIAENCPPLKDLLTEPIDVTNIPTFIPWTSVSTKHKEKLNQVARRQKCNVVKDILWFHEDIIGNGSFGEVFAGINEDGREVAIKRIVRLPLQRPEEKREITNLIALADCEQVVRYLFFVEDESFIYVVLELMEGNLDEYLDNSTFDKSRNVQLCEDVVEGLKFLHEQNILHRDLKPGNILYKKHPKLCLKIGDFGLSRSVSGSRTNFSTVYGTRCWIAPELLKCRKDHSKSSDMFSCGLVLHYILSLKKHPFSKNNKQIQHEIEGNITEGKMEGFDDSLSAEATHLVKHMLKSDKNDRPIAGKALDHPLFWSKEKKVDFLVAVGNQTEFECPRAKRTSPITAVETDLEKNFSTIVRYGNWIDPGYLHMPDIYDEMTRQKRKSYDTISAVELVRFIRNAYAHVSEDKRPTLIRNLLLEDFVFLDYFPHLFMEVYKAVTTHGWDQTIDEIKYAVNK